MKTILCFTLTLITIVTIAFVPNSSAQDNSPEYVVRVIYFIPNDRQPKSDIDTQLDTLIKDIQQFYANQMEAHGFERKTFRYEADDAGNVVVHHVNGNFNDAYYQNPSTGSWIVWEEIETHFDMSKNIYFLALDISSKFLDGPTAPIIGRGAGGSLNGRTLIPASNFGAAHHELGHAFGLLHDSRVGANKIFTLPGYFDQMTNSFCAAEWLDVNRYFNPTQDTLSTDTNVEMLMPSLAAPPTDIRLQFEVTDPDGLHQAQLYRPYGHYPSVIAYESLSGNRATVEFVTHELVDGNQIVLRVIDKHGNFTGHDFHIEITALLPTPEIISITDTNLAAAIRDTLNLSGNNITQLDMSALTGLVANRKNITNITGLEQAKYLRHLDLGWNQITDITPLEKLQNLEDLQLIENQITDITPLEKLQNLVEVKLHNNEISDITPITKLPRLFKLHLAGNNINDISQLAGMTQVREISIEDNQISDIKPLSGLTQLYVLGIARNPISDITPVAGLTNLGVLNVARLKISDLDIIRKMTNLYFLNVAGNKITNISQLSGLTNLEVLYLAYNQITDVSPLADLTNLNELNLVGNPINNRKPLLELLRKNPGVKIHLSDKNGRTKVLPVTLSHFHAELTDVGVVIKWTTESEVDNAGFYIYRSETKDGEFKVINPAIIQGAGTTGQRNEYTWTDTTAKPRTVYYYQIEDVSHAGVREQLATVRLKGFMSAKDKLLLKWGDLKHLRQ